MRTDQPRSSWRGALCRDDLRLWRYAHESSRPSSVMLLTVLVTMGASSPAQRPSQIPNLSHLSWAAMGDPNRKRLAERYEEALANRQSDEAVRRLGMMCRQSGNINSLPTAMWLPCGYNPELSAGPITWESSAEISTRRGGSIFSVANDGSANQLWINQKNGSFKDAALICGVAYNANGNAQASMGVTAGDYDNEYQVDAALLAFGSRRLYMTHDQMLEAARKLKPKVLLPLDWGVWRGETRQSARSGEDACDQSASI